MMEFTHRVGVLSSLPIGFVIAALDEFKADYAWGNLDEYWHFAFVCQY